MSIAVYPGSFDPVTLGHLDIIRRSAAIFDHVIVGVLNNTSKKPLFSLEERVSMIKEMTAHIPNVRVGCFEGLLVDYMKEINATIIIRGLRAVTDFEYELQQADLNYRLDNELESIFVMSAPQYGYISSSVVRQIASLGSDVSNFVPSNVVKALKHRFS